MLKTYTFMLAATLVGCSFSDAGLQGGSGLTDDLGQLEDLSLADLSLPDLGLPDLGQPEDLGQPDLNVPDLGPDGGQPSDWANQLDPLLAGPGGSTPCNYLANRGRCPADPDAGIPEMKCRPISPDRAVCETYIPTAHTLDPCTSSTDCHPDSACFDGLCRRYCDFTPIGLANCQDALHHNSCVNFANPHPFYGWCDLPY